VLLFTFEDRDVSSKTENELCRHIVFLQDHLLWLYLAQLEKAHEVVSNGDREGPNPELLLDTLIYFLL